MSEIIKKEVPENKSQEVLRITVKEWMKKGKSLFGKDARLWKFRCANCGHVQSMADFIALREAGLFEGDPQVAYFSCIGRFDTRLPSSKVGTLGDPKEYCNYTLGGLIPLNKTIVLGGDVELSVFEFADQEASS